MVQYISLKTPLSHLNVYEFVIPNSQPNKKNNHIVQKKKVVVTFEILNVFHIITCVYTFFHKRNSMMSHI